MSVVPISNDFMNLLSLLRTPQHPDPRLPVGAKLGFGPLIGLDGCRQLGAGESRHRAS